jgi:ADP-ribose pyrophosphatase YjhB (NUDIX family)
MLSEADYKYIFDRVPRLCVSIAAVSAAGVVLIKRSIAPHIGKWHLPGGRVQLGETVLMCAMRVAHRELGLKLPSIYQTLGFMEELHAQYDAATIHSVDIILRFEMSIQDFSPAPGEGECQWFMRAPPVAVRHPVAIPFLITHGVLDA